MAKNVDDISERLAMLLAPSKDKANIFLWSVLSDLWTYSANRIGEIADSVVEIDRAMKLGFGWEYGPFELWDIAGVAKTVERMKKEGKPVAANVEKLLASGKTSWYADDAKVPERPRLLRHRERQLQAGRSSTRRVVGYSCEKVERCGEEEFRSLAGRSRRWRRLHRVPLQDELAGRRHRADDHLSR